MKFLKYFYNRKGGKPQHELLSIYGTTAMNITQEKLLQKYQALRVKKNISDIKYSTDMKKLNSKTSNKEKKGFGNYSLLF